MSKFLDKLFEKKGCKMPRCAAVVPAAGSSQRMGEDKLLLPLGDAPVLIHTLRALDNCQYIDEIVVVTREDLLEPISHLCKEYGMQKVTKVLQGGETRSHSVLAGIGGVDPSTELIAIHDGARPFVTQAVLEDAILKGAKTGAAAPAVPVKDTIKTAKGGIVQATPDRSTLFAIQTPQVFEASLIKGALSKAIKDGAELTDDCSAVERIKMSVTLTQGDYENIKITTPEDMILGDGLLQRRGMA